MSVEAISRRQVNWHQHLQHFGQKKKSYWNTLIPCFPQGQQSFQLKLLCLSGKESIPIIKTEFVMNFLNKTKQVFIMSDSERI